MILLMKSNNYNMNKKTLKWIEKNFNSNLNNKNIIITGANSGIGFEVSYICASLNANIIMAVRNINRGKLAKEKILKDFPKANIDVVELDVSSIDSIYSFKDYIISNNIDIDVFYNNAGILKANGNTVDGIELIMGTNYFGVVLLNNLLADYLKSLNHEVKVIFTNSIAMYIHSINYNDFFSEKKYKCFKAYAKSKRALTHYFIDYSLKCENSNVKALLVHPGITYTPLIKKSFNKVIAKLADMFMNIIFHKVDKAALSTMYLLNDNVDNYTYVGPRGLLGMSGYPKEKKIIKSIRKNYNKTIEFTNNYLKDKLKQLNK